MTAYRTPLYVAADVHGHRAELQDALRDAGLTDADGHWSGGDARLWLLGDYVDRGPDGMGVIDDVLRRLTPEHVSWITSRPAMAVVDGYLLMHSDTTRYREFGTSVAAVNAAVAAALAGREATAWLEFSRQMSDRGAFRDSDPAGPDDPVAMMLTTFGGQVLVHGHSTLTKHFGVAPDEVRDPLRYAGGRVLAMDGGVYEGGRILVTRLD